MRSTADSSPTSSLSLSLSHPPLFLFRLVFLLIMANPRGKKTPNGSRKTKATLEHEAAVLAATNAELVRRLAALELRQSTLPYNR